MSAADSKDHADSQASHPNRGSACAHKRKCLPCYWEKPHSHSHVHHGLEGNGKTQPHDHQSAKCILCPGGYPHGGEHEPDIHHDHNDAADHAKLLHNQGVDEVRIPLRQKMLVQTPSRAHAC